MGENTAYYLVRMQFLKLYFVSIWAIYDNLWKARDLLIKFQEELKKCQITGKLSKADHKKLKANLINLHFKCTRIDVSDLFVKLFYELRHFLIHSNNYHEKEHNTLFYSTEIQEGLSITIGALPGIKKDSLPQELSFLAYTESFCILEVIRVIERKSTEFFFLKLEDVISLPY